MPELRLALIVGILLSPSFALACEDLVVTPPALLRTHRIQGGGQADIYRLPDQPLVYRVPRNSTGRLDALYENMFRVLGDQMPAYHGATPVRVELPSGAFVERRGYVFDFVGAGYVAPSLENFERTPTAIRRRVADSLLALSARMGAAGYFPGDMHVDNYVYHPTTGHVMVFADSGVFIPLNHQYIEAHRAMFDSQVRRWREPNPGLP